MTGRLTVDSLDSSLVLIPLTLTSIAFFGVNGCGQILLPNTVVKADVPSRWWSEFRAHDQSWAVINNPKVFWLRAFV